MAEHPPIRLCEWSSTSVGHLSSATRREIAEAVASWTEANHLPDEPLAFSGSDGTTLSATHYVGVVEVRGCSIEIYPKLDRAILESSRVDSPQTRSSVMIQLLWMLEASGYMDLAETDAAHLNSAEVSYYDLFAFLLAKNLLAELERGVVHTYRGIQEDSSSIRGRIDLLRQCTQNWGRKDLHRCRWDEFTPDNPMNRLFKCACRHLQPRVKNPEPARLLASCTALLDEVSDVDPNTALRGVRMLWNRSNDRFRSSFDIAHRLLSGNAYEMASGSDDVFVFLLDMDHVFESFVTAAVAARFGVSVLDQQYIGHLLHDGSRSLIQQIPDMQWTAVGCKWIGDAKYKRLNGIASLESEIAGAYDGRLGAADVRQLSCYAGLAAMSGGLTKLAIFYPLVGITNPDVLRYTTWNGHLLCLVPVRIDQNQSIAQTIPCGSWMSAATSLVGN